MKFVEKFFKCSFAVSLLFFFSVRISEASTDIPFTKEVMQNISSPLFFISLILLIYGATRLISYRKEIENKALALEESEKRYSRITQGSNDGLWDWNLETNQIHFSSRWKGMIGYDDGEIDNHPDSWFLRVHPDDVDNLKNTIDAHAKELSTQMETEYRMKHKDGIYRWMLCRGLAFRNEAGKAIWIAGSQTDITDRKKAEEQLIYNALHDGLTGLANRALFIDHLKTSFKRKKRNGDYKFAVLFFDLDRFKNINDNFGHLFGNHLLEEVARRLSDKMRSQDIFARFGGDEFAFLFGDVNSSNDALLIAERINDELVSPFYVNEQKVFITASIGITLSDDYDMYEDMLRDADIAMYQAKLNRSGIPVIFNDSMRLDIKNVFHLETALRQAIKDKEFRVHYQPIVLLETQAIVGFEALIRWYKQDLGFVPVMQFISLAEETGMIIPIGNWVMKEACLQMVRWQKKFPSIKPLTIAVNVSVKQFYHPDFIKNLSETLNETGIDPHCLTLELTESCLLDNEKSLQILQQIRKLEIRLSVDDFGTGYSSLSYLHQYPIDTLKIDRSFINRMGLGGQNSAMVNTIINLAQNLNMDVIAEGVEKGEQLQILQSMKCKYFQGYFFSYPLSAKDAEDLLSRDKSAPNLSDTATYIRSAEKP